MKKQRLDQVEWCVWGTEHNVVERCIITESKSHHFLTTFLDNLFNLSISLSIYLQKPAYNTYFTGLFMIVHITHMLQAFDIV